MRERAKADPYGMTNKNCRNKAIARRNTGSLYYAADDETVHHSGRDDIVADVIDLRC
jgi:hypothetical protein